MTAKILGKGTLTTEEPNEGEGPDSERHQYWVATQRGARLCLYAKNVVAQQEEMTALTIPIRQSEKDRFLKQEFEQLGFMDFRRWTYLSGLGVTFESIIRDQRAKLSLAAKKCNHHLLGIPHWAVTTFIRKHWNVHAALGFSPLLADPGWTTLYHGEQQQELWSTWGALPWTDSASTERVLIWLGEELLMNWPYPATEGPPEGHPSLATPIWQWLHLDHKPILILALHNI